MKGMGVLRTLFILLTLLKLMSRQDAFSQAVHFSQFFEAPLLRNPSLSGIFKGDFRIQGVYRDQWNNVTDGYRTGSLSMEYKMPAGSGDNFLTLGLQALYDRAGTVGLETTEILPALNFHKSLRNDKSMYLSLGFMGGMVQKTIDRSKVTTNNQFDGDAFNPSLADGETFSTHDIRYLDGSIGVSFSTSYGKEQENSLFLGAAVHHLNRPKNSFYQKAEELKPKYVLSGGLKFDLNEYAYFTLQADHTVQGRFQETVGGCMVSYKLGDGDPGDPGLTTHLGLFLRWNDALIPVIKLDMKSLSVALSYDANISAQRTTSQGRGGTELVIAYKGFTEQANSTRNKMPCPQF
ncbi:PorP/SprF family type IX secretion system membrane protein [Flavitalea flava]